LIASKIEVHLRRQRSHRTHGAVHRFTRKSRAKGSIVRPHMASALESPAGSDVALPFDARIARIGLVMPFYNEAPNLAQTLTSIAAQTIDHRRLYFVGVDGDSSDDGRDMIEHWITRGDIAGCVVSNPRRRIPISLNAGIRALTTADLIVRLDAHTTYGPKYIEDIVAAFSNGPPDLGCVGGLQLPDDGSSFSTQLSGALLTHPFGVARLGVKSLTRPQFTDTMYLGAWRPGLLQRLGGFDENWIANEDSELESRLRAAGWRMLLIPVANRYRVTRGARSTVRQWAGYGYWRAQTIRRYPQEWRWRHAIVIAGLVVLVVGAISPWRWFLLPAYLVYALGVLVFGRGHAPFLVNLCACVVFPIVHVAYAFNFLRGLIRRPAPFKPAL
jgi:GT2 family glycosyltransferase